MSLTGHDLKEFFKKPEVRAAIVIGAALVVDTIFFKSKYSNIFARKFVKGVMAEYDVKET